MSGRVSEPFLANTHRHIVAGAARDNCQILDYTPFNAVEHVAADDNCTSEWVSERVIASHCGGTVCLVEMWTVMLRTQGDPL